jgi:hypothetical protein
VIPDGCVGLPTLAAVEQGIPVIAVRGNSNLMRNDLRSLPFKAGQLHYAANYYEAAGIMAGMKAGVAPATLTRPMQPMRINRVGAEEPVVATNGNGNGKASTNGHSNGHSNGHTSGNGHTNGTNGNSKGRKVKSVVTVEAAVAEPELLVEVGGQ